MLSLYWLSIYGDNKVVSHWFDKSFSISASVMAWTETEMVLTRCSPMTNRTLYVLPFCCWHSIDTHARSFAERQKTTEFTRTTHAHAKHLSTVWCHYNWNWKTTNEQHTNSICTVSCQNKEQEKYRVAKRAVWKDEKAKHTHANLCVANGWPMILLQKVWKYCETRYPPYTITHL